jgi:tight adherence protein B
VPPFLTVFIMAIVFTVVMAVGQTFYWAYVARKEREQTEMLRRLGVISEGASESLFRERPRDAVGLSLGSVGLHLQATIERADSMSKVSTLVGQMTVIGAVSALLIFLIAGPAIGAMGLFVGLLPYGYLRWRASKRSAKLIEQLPEALDLMARSLQAGLGLNEAFRTCAEEMPLPIAGEFGRVFEEVRFGRDYRDAFTKLLDRNPGVFDLRLFVSSVLLQRETGGNLIEILDSISNTIRGRFLFQAKVKALTSEARFSALILGGLPLCVAAILAWMRPEYLQPLWTDWMGNLFLLYFFGSYMFGGFLMYQVSKVEV